MAETFRALFPKVDVRPLTDGLAAIFNGETSDQRRYFEVVRVTVRPSSAQGAASGANAMAAKVSLCRISAASGGETIVAVKRDTASADLPAQVTCVGYPDSVTVSSVLRRLADAPSYTGTTGSNLWLGARVYGGSYTAYMRANNADTLRFSGDANVEGVVLREGQGVAMVLDAYGWPRAGQFNLTVRNLSTGASYQFRTREIGHPERLGMALVSLFNASSSGVVLSVTACEFPLDGESNFPTFRMARIEGYAEGNAVTPIAHDTGNSVPAALECLAGDFVSTLWGQGSGVPYDWQITHGATMTIAVQQKISMMRGITGSPRFSTVGVTPGLSPGQEEMRLLSLPPGNGIVLRPNEGFALLAGRGGAIESSTFGYYDVEMTVLHYPPPGGGGGGTFPNEGDVRAGEIYGPTDDLTGTLTLPNVNDVRDGVDYGAGGVEFDGDLVVPAEADVRLGTGYGADGTEFTGELDPGSGGGGTGTLYLRRR